MLAIDFDENRVPEGGHEQRGGGVPLLSINEQPVPTLNITLVHHTVAWVVDAKMVTSPTEDIVPPAWNIKISKVNY